MTSIGMITVECIKENKKEVGNMKSNGSKLETSNRSSGGEALSRNKL